MDRKIYYLTDSKIRVTDKEKNIFLQLYNDFIKFKNIERHCKKYKKLTT